MNSKLLLKLFLFFIGIELIVVWIAYLNLTLFFIGVINTLVILYMFFDFKFDRYIDRFLIYLNWLYNVIINFLNKTNSKKKDVLLSDKNIDLQKTTDTELFKAVKYFFVHYGFVISVLILILAILDFVAFKSFHLNLIVSIVFFIISFLFSYKDLLDWNIYFWNRLITPKDIVLMLDILFTMSVFIFLKDFLLYEKIFYSLVSWIIFYLFTIYILDYTQKPLKLFKSWFVGAYLLLVFVSFLSFLYFKIPAVKKYFTIEKKVIVKVPVYKEKVVYKDRKSSKNERKNEANFIVYIAPNGKYYEIFQTSTWAYFTWYANKRKYFSNIDEAKKIIDKYNPSNIASNQKNNTNNENIPSDEDQLFNVMSAILNDKNVDTSWVKEQKIYKNSSSEDNITKVMWTLLNDNSAIFTYYKLIPYIVKKFNLSSKNKSDIKFNHIDKKDPNYNAFKTAYYYKMIGKNTNPNIKVRCQNLAVIIWLANKWNLSYTRDNVFDVFWKKAVENWYKFDKCCKNKYTYITREKISCILK